MRKGVDKVDIPHTWMTSETAGILMVPLGTTQEVHSPPVLARILFFLLTKSAMYRLLTVRDDPAHSHMISN